MEAAAAELRCLLNGGPLILLVVAVTGVFKLRLRSARLRVSACEKEPGIVRPFITCCPRPDWGRRASRDSPVFTTPGWETGRGGGRSRKLASDPSDRGDALGSVEQQMGTFPGAAPPLASPPFTVLVEK